MKGAQTGGHTYATDCLIRLQGFHHCELKHIWKRKHMFKPATKEENGLYQPNAEFTQETDMTAQERMSFL